MLIAAPIACSYVAFCRLKRSVFCSSESSITTRMPYAFRHIPQHIRGRPAQIEALHPGRRCQPNRARRHRRLHHLHQVPSASLPTLPRTNAACRTNGPLCSITIGSPDRSTAPPPAASPPSHHPHPAELSWPSAPAHLPCVRAPMRPQLHTSHLRDSAAPPAQSHAAPQQYLRAPAFFAPAR